MIVKLLSILRRALKSLGLLPLIKRFLYAPGGLGAASGTGGLRYRLKLLIEQANFASIEQVHALPPIYHYWSDKHLRPKLRRLGYDSVDEFFFQSVKRAFAASPRPRRRCASLGSGNCDFEVTLARRLVDAGVGDFVIECLDVNRTMLERGALLAAEHGVAEQVRPLRTDFNSWVPDGPYDAVVANQALHHVVNLEGLFDAVAEALGPEGLFISSDMIGRNGHMRWPEALAIVNEFWRELPAAYRYDRMLARCPPEYQNYDCSKAGFEGIRAQDILPLLVQRFHFETFIAFGNVIDPFIDRAVGDNFDPDRQYDRDFIDRVQARDEALIESGAVKPTHMLAVMTVGPAAGRKYLGILTPEFCVRPPNARTPVTQ